VKPDPVVFVLFVFAAIVAVMWCVGVWIIP